MYGIDSGNGYAYGDDPAVEQTGQPDSACADTCPEGAIELSIDKPAPSGASSNNL